MASVKKKKDLTPEEREVLAREARDADAQEAQNAPAADGAEAAPAEESEESAFDAQVGLTSDSGSSDSMDALEVASPSTTAFWSSDAPSMAASLFDMSEGPQAFGLFDSPAAISFDSLGSSVISFASASPLADDPGFASAFLSSEPSGFDAPALALSLGELTSSTAPVVASDYPPDQIAEIRESLVERADEFAAMVADAVAIAFPDGPITAQFDTFG